MYYLVVNAGSEGTISTLSLELAESSWGGAMRTASPANSSRHTSYPSDFINKPEVPRLTFYWLKNPDVVKPGAGTVCFSLALIGYKVLCTALQVALSCRINKLESMM